MGIAFVTPETVTLPLSDGESIVIKRRLTHGESDDMMARMLPHMTPGEKMQVESKGVRTAKVLAYLLTWSSPIPMSPMLSVEERIATLNGLDPDSFTEIEQAIDRHVEADAADRAAKKKASRIPIASGATSVSAD